MKGDIPKFKKAFKTLFERHKFLDGTYYTFFGPGQLRDDTWIMPDINPDTQEYLGYHVWKNWDYIKPTDWVPKEAPLFPPQVVRININIYGAYGNAGTPAPNYDVGLHYGDPDAVPYTFFYEPATTEHERLLEIATNAKKRIEKIRKGRTWINIENFAEGSVERGGLCFPFDLDADGSQCNTINYPYRLNAFNYGDLRNVGLFLDVANPDLDFFGTDFLGIYLGDHIFTPIGYGDSILFGDFDVQPKWLAMKDIILKIYKRFVRFSEILFPCDIGTDIYASAQIAIANDIARINGIGTVFDVLGNLTINDLSNLPDHYITYYPLPSGGYQVFTSIESTPQDFQATYYAVPITPSITNFTKVIQWAKDNKIDITSPGKTSTIGSEEQLINLIANHYNFHPTSGKDIKE